ncbi:MAG TPA: (2Fe-2S)-binding protein, partial [Micromonospora sp.]
RALLLGRALGGEPATRVESPALMPDSAVVCQCNTVPKSALVRCWRAGARSVAEVVAATRATTGCGGCRDAVAGIVDWLSTVDDWSAEGRTGQTRLVGPGRAAHAVSPGQSRDGHPPPVAEPGEVGA